MKKESEKGHLLPVVMSLGLFGLVLMFLLFSSPGSITGNTSYPDAVTGYNITSCGEIIAPGVYNLMNNIYIDYNFSSTQCLIINSSDNIVLEGNGFTLSGNKDSVLILVNGVSNITIKNLTVTNSSYGIGFYKASNSRLLNINASLNKYNRSSYMDGTGISDSYGTNNVFENILLENNGYQGIALVYTNHSTLRNITALFNGMGIIISGGINNTFRDNNFSGNRYNFYLNAQYAQLQDIDTSNIVDYDKRIYYNYSISDYTFDLSNSAYAGTLVCTNCNNITVQNLNFSHNNGVGIFFDNCTNSLIRNVTSSYNGYGIYLSGYDAKFIYVENSVVEYNGQGLFISSWRGSGLVNYAISNFYVNNLTANYNTFQNILAWCSNSFFYNNHNFGGNANIQIRGNGNRVVNTTVYNASYGLTLFGKNNTVITFVAVFNSSSSTYGISTNSMNESYLENLNISYAAYGIYLGSSFNNKISNFTALNNLQYGLWLVSSYNNTLINITASNNGQYGVHLSSSSNNNLLTNSITSNNTAYGIFLGLSSNNTLINNVANMNNEGIILSSSSNNNLINNTANNNRIHGMDLSSNSNNNLIAGNVLDGNVYDGILIFADSDKNFITNNTLHSNQRYGLQLSSSSNNLLFNLTASNNHQGGIYLSSSSNNSFSNLSVLNNGIHGITLYASSYNNFNTLNVSNNIQYGLNVYAYSENNTFEKVVVSNNSYGVYVASSNNVFRNTFASNNSYGFFLDFCLNASFISAITSNNSFQFFIQNSNGTTIQNSNGSIKFLSNISVENLILYTDLIIGKKFVYLNSTKNPGMNVSAEINLDLNGLNISAPKILKDGNNCSVPQCRVLSYVNNVVVFNVTSWSNYSVIEGCGDGSCNNGETCSTCSSDCGSCGGGGNGGSGGGSGGGGGGGGTTKKNVSVLNETVKEETNVLPDNNLPETLQQEEPQSNSSLIIWIVVSSIFVLLLGIIVFVLFKRRPAIPRYSSAPLSKEVVEEKPKKAEPLKQPEKIESTTDDTYNLGFIAKALVKQAREMGYSSAEIRQKFRETGWTDEKIDEIMD
jgi:parallel beta-helix repeat protein